MPTCAHRTALGTLFRINLAETTIDATSAIAADPA
jgi:hypothetical protein